MGIIGIAVTAIEACVLLFPPGSFSGVFDQTYADECRRRLLREEH